jgi:4-hydroxythreonine-4-phosphate dehydrogenase
MRVGITIGDAAGIGPEIIEKALAVPPVGLEPVIYGDESLVRVDADVVDVLADTSFSDIEPGRPDPRCARLQLAALMRAIDDAKRGMIDAIVTAPWTKALFETIDQPATGHTEILAREFGVADEHVMMLAGDRLRVALVTTHLPLRDVADAVTPERLLRTLRITVKELRQSYRIERPRVAVCGLNPHAGEAGHIGTEDRDVVGPTLERARREIEAEIVGPLASDTLFVGFRDRRTPYDAVVAMYHDQGLIPLKLVHFGESANITLGLPVVRTSVDHGSAWDIAGEGVADPSSMKYAIDLAVRLVENRRRNT